jgi:hypothetical protein
MKFEEIFNQPGLYVADGFSKGFCFKITKDQSIKTVSYKKPDDLIPEEADLVVYKGLFSKDYKPILSVKSLF